MERANRNPAHVAQQRSKETSLLGSSTTQGRGRNQNSCKKGFRRKRTRCNPLHILAIQRQAVRTKRQRPSLTRVTWGLQGRMKQIGKPQSTECSKNRVLVWIHSSNTAQEACNFMLGANTDGKGTGDRWKGLGKDGLHKQPKGRDRNKGVQLPRLNPCLKDRTETETL